MEAASPATAHSAQPSRKQKKEQTVFVQDGSHILGIFWCVSELDPEDWSAYAFVSEARRLFFGSKPKQHDA